MANLINLESVHKSYGVRPLLDGVSLGVAAGERIGVVGLNGGGKTTLLEVLSGLEEPDTGRVSHSRDLRMAVVTQRTELPAGSTVRNAVLDPHGFTAEHEWAADPKVRAVLDGLGMTVRIALFGLALAVAAWLGAALLRLSPWPVARGMAHVYVGCLRNTPLLLQLFFVYFLFAPAIGVGPFGAAVLALGLFEGAYMAELFRAGLQSVPRAQWEAGITGTFS